MRHRLLVIQFIFALFTICASANPDFNLADRGQACFKDSTVCKLDSNVQDIIALTHFLHKKGVEKNRNQDFASGTFIFEDPGHRITNAMRDYVSSIYGERSCDEVTVSTKSAYPRKSTHFNPLYFLLGKAKRGVFGGTNKIDCDYVHFGIDVGPEKLPMVNKRHILFGRVGTINDKDLSFIKLEQSGLSGFDAVKHGIDLVRTAANRFLPGMIRKIKATLGITKVTPASIEKEFNDLLESTSFATGDELGKDRKERIPAEFLAQYLSLYLAATNNKKDVNFNRAKEYVKAFGVQAMIPLIASLAGESYVPAELQNRMGQFIDQLKSRYPEDFSMRFGNEIIIQKSDAQ